MPPEPRIDPASRTSRARAAAGCRTPFVLLLCVDLLLIVLHVLLYRTPYVTDPRFMLGMERGYGELLQYAKALWAVAGFLWLAWRTSEWPYAVWSMVFGYVLLDDALQLHERLGVAVASRFGIQGAFGLYAEDLGELAVLGAAGLVTVILAGLAYVRGSASFRRRSRLFALLLALFAVFGGGVDALHRLVDRDPLLDLAVGVLEDGGEMIVMSAICACLISILLDERRSRPA